MSGVGQRAPRMSLRNTLAVALVAVALYVPVLAVSVGLAFLPRVTALRTDTDAIMSKLEGYSRHAAALDTVLSAVRTRLGQGSPDDAATLLRAARRRPPSSLSEAGARALVGAPLEMRYALTRAADQE
ncbi:MAG: hypothetical protein FIA95_14915, partial [Gemmatimonadetes bacterium]|nr:hypothetical protein [Gemmatimonadota bacterium]